MLRKTSAPLSKFMKHWRLYSSASSSWCTPAQTETRVTVLPNGLKVATEETSSPLACIALLINTGARFESPCNNGIAHFIEHIAFRGFNTMKKEQLECELFCNGAKFTAETTREVQIFTAKCIPEYTSEILNIFSKIVTDLELSDEELEHEKYNMCLELIDMDNNPKEVVFDYLHETAFQGTPLAQHIIGPSRNIRSFSKAMVSHFLCEQYVPSKMTVAASGNLRHEVIVQNAESKLGMNIPSSCDEPYSPCRYTGSQISYRDDSMPYAHVAVTVEVPGFDNPDYYTLLVASCIVGSWHKSQGGIYNLNASPVAQAASSLKLIESFDSFYLTYSDIGLWGVYFVSEKMGLDDFVINLQYLWLKLSTMCTKSDTQRGINQAKMKLAQSMNGCVNSCRDIGIQVMYTCARKSARDHFQMLDTVTAQAVRKVCDKYLYDRCPAVAAVGTIDNLPDYLRIRHGMFFHRL